MKRLIFYCLTMCLIFIGLPASAQQKQKFSVANFEYNPFDMAAQSAKLDGSGNRYAIIKVSSTNPDDDLKEYTFNFGNLRSFVEEHDNELWVYVQKNAKTVTITRNGYVPVNRYDLKTTIESGKTYTLLLSTATTVIYKQMLQFVVSPANSNAIVTVRSSKKDAKDEVLGTVDANGSIVTALEYGVYTYSVISPNHQVSEGRITLNDKTKTFVEQVELYEGQPYQSQGENTSDVKFTLSPSVNNAQVLIKQAKPGAQEVLLGITDSTGTITATIDNDKYSYRVVSADYHIAGGELDLTAKPPVTDVEVELRPNFSTVTLFVDMDADIYLNGDLKGSRTWTGVLKSGKYQVECKREKHRNSVQVITVGDDDVRDFKLTPPEPITGALAISSTPLASTVSIDGKEYGKTPLNVNDILVGNYKLTLSHEGYMTKEQPLEVKEGQVSELNIELYAGGLFTFESDPEGAELYINGNKVGETPYSQEMLSGDYEVRLQKPKYIDFTKKIRLEANTLQHKFKMKHQLIKKNSFYWQFSGQAGSALGAGLNLGFYAHNFNMEFFGTYMFDTEKLYRYSVNNHEEGEVKGIMMGGKLGYGIKLSRMFRITPQVGGAHLLITDFGDSYADFVTVGVRGEMLLSRGFGISLTPEASFAVKKGKLYEQISEVSSKVKGWSDGFNARFGLFFNL